MTREDCPHVHVTSLFHNHLSPVGILFFSHIILLWFCIYYLITNLKTSTFKRLWDAWPMSCMHKDMTFYPKPQRNCKYIAWFTSLYFYYFSISLIPLATSLLIAPDIFDFYLNRTVKKCNTIPDLVSCVNTNHRLSASQYKYWRIIKRFITNKLR